MSTRTGAILRNTVNILPDSRRGMPAVSAVFVGYPARFRRFARLYPNSERAKAISDVSDSVKTGESQIRAKRISANATRRVNRAMRATR